MFSTIIRILIFFIITIAPIHAAILSIGGQGGITQFEENFEDSTHFGGKIHWLSRTGIMLEGSGYYFEATSNTDNSDLKAAVALLGANYALPIFKAIRPYVGGGAGFAKLSSAYDNSPSLAYYAKAGISLRLAKDLRFYAEGTYMDIQNSQEITLQPLFLTGGINIDFQNRNRRPKRRKSIDGEAYPYTPIQKRPERGCGREQVVARTRPQRRPMPR